MFSTYDFYFKGKRNGVGDWRSVSEAPLTIMLVRSQASLLTSC